MTFYHLGLLYLLGVLLFLLVRRIKIVLPSFWSLTPQYGIGYLTAATARSISSQPGAQRQVQNTIGLSGAGSKEPEGPCGMDTSRVDLPTIQPSPGSDPSDTDIEALMLEVEQLLAHNRVSKEEKEALTTHQRGYFAHQHAAKLQLSQGSMEGFKRELKCAQYELADLIEILHHYRSN